MIKNKIVTEIVEFKILDNIEEVDFLRIVDFLEKDFHSKEKGFIDTEIIRGKKEREYIMIQHWESMEDCKSVIKKMMQEEITEKFRNALDPKTVKMNISEQLQFWKNF